MPVHPRSSLHFFHSFTAEQERVQTAASPFAGIPSAFLCVLCGEESALVQTVYTMILRLYGTVARYVRSTPWEVVSRVTKSPHPLRRGWYRSFMQHVTRSGNPIQNPESKIQNELSLVICHLYSRKLQVLVKKVGNSRGKTGSFRGKTGNSRGKVHSFPQKCPLPLAPHSTLHASGLKPAEIRSFPYFCHIFKDLHKR